MPVQLIVDTPEIGLVTKNMQAMRHFYETIVGLNYQQELEFSGGRMHRYQFGAGVLKLVELDEIPTENTTGSTAMSVTGYRYCTLVIGNLREFIEEVKQAGFPTTEITNFADGIGFAFVQDPDGNFLELAGPI